MTLRTRFRLPKADRSEEGSCQASARRIRFTGQGWGPAEDSPTGGKHLRLRRPLQEVHRRSGYAQQVIFSYIQFLLEEVDEWYWMMNGTLSKWLIKVFWWFTGM